MHFSMITIGPKRQWVYLLVAFLSLAGAALICHAAQIQICLFKSLTGFPCPTCGSTRAGLALIRGDLTAAFRLNPLAALLLPLVGLYTMLVAICAVFTRKIPVVTASRRTCIWLIVILLILAAANWAYLIAGTRGEERHRQATMGVIQLC